METMIGKIARSKSIHIVPDMPRRAFLITRLTGDIITLANPDIVEQIRELVEGCNVGPPQETPRRHQMLRR
jgi:hypothetical protein